MNTDSPAPPPDPAPPPSPAIPLLSDRLLQLIDQAEAEFVAGPGGRAVRGDGWSAGKIRIFLETLAACGRVTQACAAAGMSRESAYQLRHRAQGRAFHTGWNAARLVARARLADDLGSGPTTGNGHDEAERRSGLGARSGAMKSHRDRRATTPWPSLRLAAARSPGAGHQQRRSAGAGYQPARRTASC